MPLPATSITIGDPPQILQPPHEQVSKSKSPPNIRHLLAKVLLQLVLVDGQQSPLLVRIVPAGQVPSKNGVVQLLGIVLGRLQENCSGLISRQRLPPVIVTLAAMMPAFTVAWALGSAVVAIRHIEIANA